MTSTGRRNDTRIAEYEGLSGNRKEATWDKTTGQHTCCGARVSWRHHKDCETKKGDTPYAA
jgi:hypothetical protein